MFKSREHESATNNSTGEDSTLLPQDDDAIVEPVGRALGLESLDSFYETNLSAGERLDIAKKGSTTHKDLPTKKCDPWMPSVVPRKKTVSSMWNGASSDPESRAFSASHVSRPRKLHSSFLQYQALFSETNLLNSPDSKAALEGIMDNTSSLVENSWLTSAVLLNIPKYSLRKSPVGNMGVILPVKIQKTVVDYGDSAEFEPLRISFETDHLVDFSYQKRGKQSVTASAILAAEALTGDILPAVSDIWANALSIVRSSSGIFPSSNSVASDTRKCGDADIPRHHLTDGVPNSDVVIYLTSNGPQCYSDGDTPSGVLSYSTVCSFDQHMRPISANIVICFHSVDLSLGEVSTEESLRLTASLTIEVGKVLGMSPPLYQYFRNAETGKPFGATRKEVTCVDGSRQTILMPNVLQATSDLIRSPSYEIVTPTVRQVVRNHFDCQSLRGARLGRGGKSSSCFGDYFDPRYHFDDDFAPTGGSADMAYSLSPLTLALLEDSGWYRANFALSTTPLFGRGAGCGFLEGDCASDSKDVPEYNRGFFCGDSSEGNPRLDRQPLGCDYTHNHKADCAVSLGIDATCPMRKENIVSCADKSNSPSLVGEVFSENSRCFETNANSVCLESYCNSVDSKIDILVDGKVYQCDYEGQLVDLNMDYYVRCPRLAVVCPHLVCPANCSGKGVCDYCLEEPQCICDNIFDESKGCFG
jgi:leishmanolysin-like peptidase